MNFLNEKELSNIKKFIIKNESNKVNEEKNYYIFKNSLGKWDCSFAKHFFYITLYMTENSATSLCNILNKNEHFFDFD